MFASPRGPAARTIRKSKNDDSGHESELVRMLGRLERANGDLRRTVLVAGHDLQEPIRVIVSNCELMQRQCSDEDGQTADALHSIASGAERLRDTVKALLTYCVATTARDDEWVEMPLTFLCQEAELKLADVIAASKARIRRDNLPLVCCDRNGLVQVFQNLIGNSIKYCANHAVPVIDVSATSEGGNWLIEVADNGIGIDSSDAERIFDPFTRLHGTEIPGTGIGLAICRNVIEQHGGNIWAQRSPKGGASFCFTLPRMG